MVRRRTWCQKRHRVTIFSIDVMKKKIALVYGGNSSEWEISVMSGRNVAQSLDSRKYDVYEISFALEDLGIEGGLSPELA